MNADMESVFPLTTTRGLKTNISHMTDRDRLLLHLFLIFLLLLKFQCDDDQYANRRLSVTGPAGGSLIDSNRTGWKSQPQTDGYLLPCVGG